MHVDEHNIACVSGLVDDVVGDDVNQMHFGDVHTSNSSSILLFNRGSKLGFVWNTFERLFES